MDFSWNEVLAPMAIEKIKILGAVLELPSAIFHSIKLPFDAEVAEKILNGIYYVCTTSKCLI